MSKTQRDLLNVWVDFSNLHLEQFLPYNDQYVLKMQGRNDFIINALEQADRQLESNCFRQIYKATMLQMSQLMQGVIQYKTDAETKDSQNKSLEVNMDIVNNKYQDAVIKHKTYDQLLTNIKSERNELLRQLESNRQSQLSNLQTQKNEYLKIIENNYEQIKELNSQIQQLKQQLINDEDIIKQYKQQVVDNENQYKTNNSKLNIAKNTEIEHLLKQIDIQRVQNNRIQEKFIEQEKELKQLKQIYITKEHQHKQAKANYQDQQQEITHQCQRAAQYKKQAFNYKAQLDALKQQLDITTQLQTRHPSQQNLQDNDFEDSSIHKITPSMIQSSTLLESVNQVEKQLSKKQMNDKIDTMNIKIVNLENEIKNLRRTNQQLISTKIQTEKQNSDLLNDYQILDKKYKQTIDQLENAKSLDQLQIIRNQQTLIDQMKKQISGVVSNQNQMYNSINSDSNQQQQNYQTIEINDLSKSQLNMNKNNGLANTVPSKLDYLDKSLKSKTTQLFNSKLLDQNLSQDEKYQKQIQNLENQQNTLQNLLKIQSQSMDKLQQENKQVLQQNYQLKQQLNYMEDFRQSMKVVIK